MILNTYNQIINEHFDISHTKTRKWLITLEDSEQTQMLSALSSALYDKIVDKVDDIDFGSIPRSRGDITKVDGFDNTMECLQIMHRLVDEYHQDPAPVDVVIQAIENVKQRKPMFMKAYAMNVELPMLLYNLIVASIENSVTYLISVCIQYIKDPETGDMAAALDKTAYNNVKANMIYEQLSNFNASCASGDLDAAMNNILNGGKRVAEAMAYEDSLMPADPKDIQSPFDEPIHEEEPEDNVEDNPYMVHPGDDLPGSSEEIMNGSASVREFGLAAGVGTALAVGAGAVYFSLKGYQFLVAVLIPTMRNIVYFFINMQVSIKAWLAIQAEFIELNAYKLQNSDRYAENPKKMKQVVNKQLKIANKLKRMSGKIASENKKAEKKATEMIKKEPKKMKVEDLKDDIPAEIYDKSVLF